MASHPLLRFGIDFPHDSFLPACQQVFKKFLNSPSIEAFFRDEQTLFVNRNADGHLAIPEVFSF